MLTYAGVEFRYDMPEGPGHREGNQAAVRGVSLNVPHAAFLLLAGESGSGKSTLLRMANGLIPHFHRGVFRGSVLVDGVDSRQSTVRDLAAKVGVVFQNQQAQLFNDTVARELAFGPRNQRLSRAVVAARVQWAAERVGIVHLLPRSIVRLSGGEIARVAIASVLTMRPPLLILDEPSAALDPVGVAALWDLLVDLNRAGTAVMLAEHRTDNAWEHDCSVALMRQGHLAFDGPLAEALHASREMPDLSLPRITRLFIAANRPERPVTPADAASVIRAKQLVLYGCPDRQPAPGDLLVHADGVAYERDRAVVLDAIDVRLYQGEIVALVGANGAGKTTLLRLLAGLIHPQRGRVTGADGQPFPRARLGLLLQNADDALFCASVRAEVEFSSRALGTYDRPWIQELFARFALEPLLDRSPFSLSDGEKRRVALAAMLAHRPDVVLLDEPTAGQDRQRREALVETIALLRARGAAVLMATHDLAFASEHCSRWLVLDAGTLAADTTPAVVLSDAALLARVHLLPTPLARLAAILQVPYPGETARLTAPLACVETMP